MNAAAAEARHLARRVQARHHCAAGREHPRAQIGFQAAQRLAGQDIHPDGDQGAVCRGKHRGRSRHPRQALTEQSAGRSHQRQLGVLADLVDDLGVAGLDLPAQRLLVHGGVADQGVHAAHQLGKAVAHHEVGPMIHERLHRPLHGAAHPLQGQAQVAVGEVGILLAARQREFLLDDGAVEHEPGVGVVVAGDVAERAERIEAGIVRKRQAPPAGIKPQTARPRQHPDAVVGPDGIPVAQALGVVPHPVRVDQAGPGLLGGELHLPVHVGGYAADHEFGGWAEALGGPVVPHQIVIAADAAGGENHRARAELELARDHP